MRLCLQVSEREVGRNFSHGSRFGLAVVDLDKAEAYPLNFVCMLPVSVKVKGKGESAFVKVFGGQSAALAQQLLLEALDQETDAGVIAEIERRLKLLEAKPDVEKKCSSCGRTFQVKPEKGNRQKFCPDCLTKKYGGRK
jgi:hypothetical protein